VGLSELKYSRATLVSQVGSPEEEKGEEASSRQQQSATPPRAPPNPLSHACEGQPPPLSDTCQERPAPLDDACQGEPQPSQAVPGLAPCLLFGGVLLLSSK